MAIAIGFIPQPPPPTAARTAKAVRNAAVAFPFVGERSHNPP